MQMEPGSGGRGSLSPENIKGQLPPRAWPAISLTACQTFKALQTFKSLPLPRPLNTTVSSFGQHIYCVPTMCRHCAAATYGMREDRELRLKPPLLPGDGPNGSLKDMQESSPWFWSSGLLT